MATARAPGRLAGGDAWENPGNAAKIAGALGQSQPNPPPGWFGLTGRRFIAK
jgi:hypothetical protein